MPRTSKSEIQSVSIDDRKLIASAIVEGLINPVGIRFERLATEGGDYDQDTTGNYTQSGGGNHNQTGGDYNQSKAMLENYLDTVSIATLVKGIRQG